MTEIKDAEIVPETALVKPNGLTDLVKEQDRPLLGILENTTLDWKSLKPNQMAILLMQRPFPVSGGGTTYLTLRQALYFAVRAYELGVSPFSSGVWFDPARFSVNLTLEGKREVARNRGIELGPPKFISLSREWKDVPKLTQAAEEAKKAGFTKDVGYTCQIRVGDPKNQETSDYTAWLSEWYQAKSPMWQQKPEHMLQIRSQEKAISMCLGTGASSMPDEKELA